MHQLKTIQKLPVSIEEAWNFFSSPENLKVITPPELNLVPTTELPVSMYPGMFIEYSVKPLLGIPVKWVTEITHVSERVYFIDEQRLGPYKIWHHQHHFEPIQGGVLMTDIVDYRLPFGPIGMLLQKVFIGRKIRSIFKYRESKLVEIFGRFEQKKERLVSRSE